VKTFLCVRPDISRTECRKHFDTFPEGAIVILRFRLTKSKRGSADSWEKFAIASRYRDGVEFLWAFGLKRYVQSKEKSGPLPDSAKKK